MEKQKTIKRRCSFSGKGIHTGVFTTITLLPAKENTGVVFVRTDKNNFRIEANIDNVICTERSTSIGKENIEIKTVEHLLAAIYGNNIDNLIIEIDNKEVPILDGSSKEFCQEIRKNGILVQKNNKIYYNIKKRISYKDEESGTEITILPSDKFMADVTINYESNSLGVQNHILENIVDFNDHISSSRTFCFFSELESMIEKNLIKGGDLNNAIVIIDNKFSDEKISKLAKYFNKKDIKKNNNGILNNIELRYKNEAARHKLLDLIGDLSLIGIPIKGKIIAKKPGHKHNTNFAKKLKKIIINDMKTTQPVINLEKKPIYNKKEIEKILPHRDPFLFIDEIRELGEDYIVGIKFVKKEEYYFKGHFPGAPVMPGVIQLETMAQTGGVLILSTIKDPENYLTFFMKIDNAKFKRKVVPGDTVIFRLELISPIRRGLCHMHGTGFVNNNIVVEADLLAQISKKI